ncbi:MAG TPA: hypothetical protein VMV48_10920 [Gallionellaceae bacterium]|nr:hypothetical protein [Gallionellaceae bacterium]
MNTVHIKIHFVSLLALLWFAPAIAATEDIQEGNVPRSNRPCFIIVSDKLVFDGNKVSSIEVMDNNITSRRVVVNFGTQFISIPLSDEVTAVKYLTDLMKVIQKSCK